MRVPLPPQWDNKELIAQMENIGHNGIQTLNVKGTNASKGVTSKSLNNVAHGNFRSNWGTPRALCSIRADYVIARRDNVPHSAPNCLAALYSGPEFAGIDAYWCCPSGECTSKSLFAKPQFDCYKYMGVCKPSKGKLIQTTAVINGSYAG